MSYIKKYEHWLTHEAIDEETKKELMSIRDDEKEIEDRFYKDLEFGTAGLRGKIGAGSNRMNFYTLGTATQGLANYIKALGKEAMEKGVAIAYDSRNFSKEFAQRAALVLNANGIKTFLFQELKSTPELSFAVRYLQTIGGIVITASHNPAEYNGYKVYSPAGIQLSIEESQQVIDQVKKIEDFSDIGIMDQEKAIQQGLFNIIPQEVDQEYLKAIKTQSLHRDTIKEVAEDFKIVYTPLHGAGNKPIQKALKEVGFKNVFSVPQQAQPDGNFPTVKYPNPEERPAFQLALELAQREEAHIAIATDPDVDRVGVVFRDKGGEYTALNGNQTGALLSYYILSTKKDLGILPENGAVIKTIVTSELGANIAKSYGVEVFNTLTGFKFIGELIETFKNTCSHEFILGYEESYGYLIGEHARDKDAVVTSMMICQMAAYYYQQGKTLGDVLDTIYEEFGYFYEDLESITLEGKEGMEKINRILTYFREDYPITWQGKKVNFLEDYLVQKQYDLANNLENHLELPASNVLKFTLEDDSWFCIRPSGTEPKIKFYFSVKSHSMEQAKIASDQLKAEVLKTLESI